MYINFTHPFPYSRDQWIDGRRYYAYLNQEHDFPLRKLKWPKGPRYRQPESHCMKLINGEPKFNNLPFPTETEFAQFQEEMRRTESTL